MEPSCTNLSLPRFASIRHGLEKLRPHRRCKRHQESEPERRTTTHKRHTTLVPQRLKVDDWEQMIDVNLKGVLCGIAAVLPHMKAQKSGHIFNTSSVAGYKVSPGSAVYAATKTAVLVISVGLRQEVKLYNIRTTVIPPGSMKTELADSITEPDIADGVRKFADMIGVTAETFANIVSFAISQPEDVDINEILFRPTKQEL